MMEPIQDRARIGIPYLTSAEEAAGNLKKFNQYADAVRAAGGDPVAISLRLSDAELKSLLKSLDAFVLPGSPADVDPALYGAVRHPRCGEADPPRERADRMIFDHIFAEQKPLLAICYGVQSLNTYLGGTLVQDIASEVSTTIRHSKDGLPKGSPDPVHEVRVELGTKLAEMACATEVRVNSSHHQSVLSAGRGLKISAVAPDGVIEAVEWVGTNNVGGDAVNWIVGVQWHPERTIHEKEGDALSEAIFRALVRTAAGVAPQAT
jgi:putative glutamine amidotransferase